MRAFFSILGLVMVMGVVGFLAKSQVGSVPTPKVDLGVAQATSQSVATPTVQPGITPAEQSQQIQRQFKQAVETALQPARTIPDEK